MYYQYFDSKLHFRSPDVVDVGLRFCPSFTSFFFKPANLGLSKRKSTKLYHMFGNEPNLKTHVQNLGYPLPKMGARKLPIFDVFRRLRNLTANIFVTKLAIDNRGTSLEPGNYKGFPTLFLNFAER